MTEEFRRRPEAAPEDRLDRALGQDDPPHQPARDPKRDDERKRFDTCHGGTGV